MSQTWPSLFPIVEIAGTAIVSRLPVDFCSDLFVASSTFPDSETLNPNSVFYDPTLSGCLC